ncbi:MAG: hypothetical protein RJB66_1318 [Pseudomonadota bacterium]|jgi:hypothetical protein
MKAEALNNAPEATKETNHQNSERPLSEFIFDLDWSKVFPYSLTTFDQIEIIDASTAQQFILEHHKSTFQLEYWGNRFFTEGTSDAKLRYYQKIADHFLLTHQGQPIGLVIGTLMDGHSYYLRYGMILRDFSSAGRIQGFVKYLLSVLATHHIDRVETDVSPANLVNVHVFNKLQFNITGLNLSERWGALIRFTKILNSNAEIIFLDQFCAGPRPQMDSPMGELIPITKKQGGKP